MSFKVSFLVVGAASDFEASLWIYFSLSMGWALFALATLHLSRRYVTNSHLVYLFAACVAHDVAPVSFRRAAQDAAEYVRCVFLLVVM
jgi:hypothetical protein